MQEMSIQNQASRKLLDERLAELRENLEAAKRISTRDLAAQISEIGFRCIKCGECCVDEDCSVVVFPFEIRRIMAATGEGWLDCVEPPAEGEWDSQGNFHTLEWRIKKENGSCKFYSDGNCRIHAARPFICSTYPFYLDDCLLRCSQCRGFRRQIEPANAEEMAARLIERRISEVQESIALLERYQDFQRGSNSAHGACIVHDSEGEHIISWDLIPVRSKLCVR
jgi:Fe-S-cluster containining protein